HQFAYRTLYFHIAAGPRNAHQILSQPVRAGDPPAQFRAIAACDAPTHCHLAAGPLGPSRALGGGGPQFVVPRPLAKCAAAPAALGGTRSRWEKVADRPVVREPRGQPPTRGERLDAGGAPVSLERLAYCGP